MFRLHNLSTPPYYLVSEAELGELAEVHGSFGFPVIVKPRSEGSSIGVTKVETLAQLEAAVRAALALDPFALVERFVRAMEVHVGVLDGRVLGAIEIVPKLSLIHI